MPFDLIQKQSGQVEVKLHIHTCSTDTYLQYPRLTLVYNYRQQYQPCMYDCDRDLQEYLLVFVCCGDCCAALLPFVCIGPFALWKGPRRVDVNPQAKRSYSSTTAALGPDNSSLSHV